MIVLKNYSPKQGRHNPDADLDDIIPLISDINKDLFESIIKRYFGSNEISWYYYIDYPSVKKFIYCSLFPKNVSVACSFYQSGFMYSKSHCDDILKTREAFLDENIRFIPLIYGIEISIPLKGVSKHAVSVIIDKLKEKIYYLDVLCYSVDSKKLKQKLKQFFRFDIDSFSIVDITAGNLPLQPNKLTFSLYQLIHSTTELPTYEMCVIYSHYINCLLIKNMNKTIISSLGDSDPILASRWIYNIWNNIKLLITDNQLIGFTFLIIMIKNETKFGIDEYNKEVELFKRDPKHSQNIRKCTSDCEFGDDNKCSCFCENNDCFLPKKLTNWSDFRLNDKTDSNVARCHITRCQIEKLTHLS